MSSLVEEDVVYGHAGRDLLADVYRPHADRDLGIAIVHVHGGAWRRGSRKMLRHLAEHMSSLGYTVVCPEYRLIQEAAWPASLHDVKAAIRWTRSNAAVLGVNPDEIVVQGHSAGGQLALMCAGTPNHPEWEGESGTPGISTSVAAVVAAYPVCQFYLTNPGDPERTYPLPAIDGSMPAYLLLDGQPTSEEARRISPLTYASADFPSTMFWLGGDDGYTPVEGSFAMYRTLRDAGVTVDLSIIGEAGHAFDMAPGAAYGIELQTAADHFIRRTLRERAQRQQGVRAFLPEEMWSRTREASQDLVGEGQLLFDTPGLPVLSTS